MTRVPRSDVVVSIISSTMASRVDAEERIGTSIHFLPVHTQTAYRERFPGQPPLAVAEKAGEEVLSLPLSPAHSDEDVEDAIDALRRVHARFLAG